MPKPKRLCALCGTPATLTKEHIWPDWMKKIPIVIEATKHQHGTRDHEYMYHTESFGTTEAFWLQPEKRIRTDLDTDLRVKVLCDPCNRKILGTREGAIKKTLTAMIEGESLKLDQPTVTRVAAWGTKTAMMYEFDDPQSVGFSKEQRHALRKKEEPPHDTDVWLGRYTDQGRGLISYHRGGPLLQIDESQLGTALTSTKPVGREIGRFSLTRLAVGSLAFFVASTAPPESRSLLTRNLPTAQRGWVKIWPNPPEHLDWPIALGVTRQDLWALGFCPPGVTHSK